MKKHNPHRVVVRRKKTNDEIRSDNHARRVALAQKPVEPEPQLPVWDELNSVHASCQQLLQSIVPVSQLFVNKDLLAALGQNVFHLRDMAQALNNDVQQYISNLNAIHEQHKNRAGNIEDPDELIAMLNVGGNYEQWMTSFTQVVLPVVNDIFTLANSYLPSDQQLTKPQGV